MSQLNLVTVSNKFLIECLQFIRARILPDRPEIGNAKDDVSSLESSLERFDIAEVALNDFDTLGCPCFSSGRFRVASDAAKRVTRSLKKGVGNRASLDTALVIDGAL